MLDGLTLCAVRGKNVQPHYHRAGSPQFPTGKYFGHCHNKFWHWKHFAVVGSCNISIAVR